MYKRQQGFTLAEMGVVIVIIGLIAGIVFGAVSVQMQNAKSTKTRTNLDVVREALQQYVAKNGRLPCPARPNATPTSADYGLEPTGRPQNTNDPCQNAALGSSAAGGAQFRIYRGLVPWRALGLSEDQAADGWDRYISYFVSGASVRLPNVGAVVLPNALTPGSGMRGAFTINNESGNALATEVAAALVSHGNNGWGGYLFRSLPNRMAAGGGGNLEDENTDNDLTLINAGAADSGANQFDDALVWLTVDQSLAKATTFLPSSEQARARATELMILMARYSDLPANTTDVLNNIVPRTAAYLPVNAACAPNNARIGSFDAAALGVTTNNLRDPWGTPYRYSQGRREADIATDAGCPYVITIVSAGPNRAFNTATGSDDLVFAIDTPAYIAAMNRF